MKLLTILFCSVLVFFITTNSLASEKLIIADFNSGNNINNLGGQFGAWYDPSNPAGYCYDSLNPNIKHGDSGFSWRADYDVNCPPPDYNGLWMKLNGADFSKYKKLVFWVKGDEKKGFTKVFKVELKNNKGEVGKYYVTGVTEKWQEVVIPFNKFAGITDFSSMKEFVIVFEGRVATKKEGAIYIDDIYVE